MVLRGHGLAVRVARFSPDGTRILTAAPDGTALLWQAAPWRLEDLPDLGRPLNRGENEWQARLALWRHQNRERAAKAQKPRAQSLESQDTSFREAQEAAGTGTASEADPSDTLKDVFNVSSPRQFIQAIGPNRTIRLETGDYDLTKTDEEFKEYVRWDPEHDGETLTILGVQNLTILGSQDGRSRLLVRPRYTFVLNLEQCKEVVIDNVVLGHFPELGSCTSGVVGMKDCAQISLIDCDLFGCGTEGLVLENVTDSTFEKCIVRDCTYGIMKMDGCRNLTFTECQFRDNAPYWGIVADQTHNALFTDCVIEDNRCDGSLFNAENCTNIVVTGGTIRNNRCKMTTNNPSMVVFRDTGENRGHP